MNDRFKVVHSFRLIFSMIVCAFLIGLFLCTSVFASTLEDNIGGGGSSLDAVTISPDDQDVGNWIKNQRGMTGEQLNKASVTLAPLTNMIGYAVGAIVVAVFSLVFLMTALDLLYIVFPPIRGLLYDGGGQQQGGMGGGMGMMGGMGAMGGQQAQKPRQWISDEAVQCAALMGGGQQQQGGMGGGMGMMGGMGAMGANQQEQSTKSVIGTYFKKRIFFMILLAVCAIVLTSSALLGTGVNLAQWGLKLINMVNGYIPQ